MRYGCIKEIFASIQGEGPWIGQRQIFIRFLGCDVACRYCDTPGIENDNSGRCRAQRAPESPAYDLVPRDLSADELTQFCSRLRVPGPHMPVLSLTGGEPLLQDAFLSAWLPEVKTGFRIYLETNGIHPGAMAALRRMIDVVSMDFKLPSSTGLPPFWAEHERFLEAARGTRLFVKAVITADTKLDDILRSGQLISAHDPAVPLIIQPAGGPLAPDPELLVRFQNAALGIIEDVRVIPQAHKILNLP